LKYLTAPRWGEGRFPTPAPLVGPEHFVGTAPEERIFSFYGEAITLPRSIDWTRNPGTAHWAHDLNRFGFLVQFDPAQPRLVEAMAALIQDWIAKNDRSKASPYTWGNLLNITIRMENWLRFVMQAVEADVLPWQDSDWQRFKWSVLEHV